MASTLYRHTHTHKWGRGCILSSEEKSQILLDMSAKKIEAHIKRPKTAVRNQLHVEKKQRMPKKLEDRTNFPTLCATMNTTRQPGIMVPKVLSSIGAPVSVHTVQHRLLEHEFMEYKHIMDRLQLEPRQMSCITTGRKNRVGLSLDV